MNTKWDNYNVIFLEYSAIYREKILNNDNFTFFDLLLLKNFKGLTATFTESINVINEKLIEYSKIIFMYSNKELDDIDFINKMFKLIETHKIKGFGTSFLSALISLSFPEEFPIMDKRVLYGASIVEKNNKYIYTLMEKKGLYLYIELYKKFSEESKKYNMTMRELDNKYFNMIK